MREALVADECARCTVLEVHQVEGVCGGWLRYEGTKNAGLALEHTPLAQPQICEASEGIPPYLNSQEPFIPYPPGGRNPGLPSSAAAPVIIATMPRKASGKPKVDSKAEAAQRRQIEGWLNDLIRRVERTEVKQKDQEAGLTRRKRRARREKDNARTGFEGSVSFDERMAEENGEWNPRCVDDFEIKDKSDRGGTQGIGRRILQLFMPYLSAQEKTDSIDGEPFPELHCVRTVKAIIRRLDLISGTQQAILLGALRAELHGGKLLQANTNGDQTSTTFVRWFSVYLADSISETDSNPNAKSKRDRNRLVHQLHLFPPSVPCEYERFADFFADRAAQAAMQNRIQQREQDEWKACVTEFHHTFNADCLPLQGSSEDKKFDSFEEFDAARTVQNALQVCPHYHLRTCKEPCFSGRRHCAVDVEVLEALKGRWPKQSLAVYEAKQAVKQKKADERHGGAKACRAWARVTRKLAGLGSGGTF